MPAGREIALAIMKKDFEELKMTPIDKMMCIASSLVGLGALLQANWKMILSAIKARESKKVVLTSNPYQSEIESWKVSLFFVKFPLFTGFGFKLHRNLKFKQSLSKVSSEWLFNSKEN